MINVNVCKDAHKPTEKSNSQYQCYKFITSFDCNDNYSANAIFEKFPNGSNDAGQLQSHKNYE